MKDHQPIKPDLRKPIEELEKPAPKPIESEEKVKIIDRKKTEQDDSDDDIQYQLNPTQFQIGIDDEEEDDDDEEEDIAAAFKEGSEDEHKSYDDEIYDEVHPMKRRDDFQLEVDMERFMEGSYDEEIDEEEEALEEYRKTFGQASNLDIISEKPSDEASGSISKHDSPYGENSSKR